MDEQLYWKAGKENIQIKRSYGAFIYKLLRTMTKANSKHKYKNSLTNKPNIRTYMPTIHTYRRH